MTPALGACFREDRAVPIIEPPDVASFRKEYLEADRPVILRGLVERWPAAERWSFDDLRARFGDRRVPTAGVDAGLLRYGASSGIDYRALEVRSVLDAIESGERPSWYITVDPRRYFPELMEEVEAPPYCDAALWRASRFWAGGGGTTTPLHRELTPNFLALVRGRKEVILFSRDDSRNLYAHRPWSGVPHFSRIDPRAPDLAQFPRARAATAHRAFLEPGDMLFIPRLWWHAVQTTGSSMAVNFWWAEGLWSVVPRLADLYKRTFRLSA
jgi:lysine-specific demethylase 8